MKYSTQALVVTLRTQRYCSYNEDKLISCWLKWYRQHPGARPQWSQFWIPLAPAVTVRCRRLLAHLPPRLRPEVDQSSWGVAPANPHPSVWGQFISFVKSKVVFNCRRTTLSAAKLPPVPQLPSGVMLFEVSILICAGRSSHSAV